MHFGKMMDISKINKILNLYTTIQSLEEFSNISDFNAKIYKFICNVRPYVMCHNQIIYLHCTVLQNHFGNSFNTEMCTIIT